MRVQKIADRVVKSFDKKYFHQEQVLDSGDARPQREPYITPSKITDEHLQEIADETIKNLDSRRKDSITMPKDFNQEVALESALELTIRDFQDGLFDGKIDAVNFAKLKDMIQSKKSYKKAAKSYKIYIIDAEKQQIKESTSNGLSDLQRIVDGYIEVAHEFKTKNGGTDTVYVNEEGMFGASYFFEFKGAHQPFAGNGVVVGFDADSGDSVDASSTLEEIKSKVKFLSLEEIKRKYRGASMKTASYYTSQIDKVANEIRSLVTAGELSREDGYALELGLDEVSDEIEKEAELVSPFSSDNKQASTKLQKPASYYTSQIDKVANEIRSLVTAGELSPEDGYALELGLDEVSDEIEKEASALEHDADEKYMADFGKEPGAREVDSDEPYMKGFGIRGQDAFLEMKSAKKLDARKLAKKRNAVK